QPTQSTLFPYTTLFHSHFDEALSRVQQAYLFDPLALESRKEALWIYYFSGRMPETVEQAQKTIELEPAAGLPHAMLAMVYAQMRSEEHTSELQSRFDIV